MKTIVSLPVSLPQEIEIAFVSIILPVRYEEEDIPNNFPLRKGNEWAACVNIDSGLILDWPKGQNGELRMKVCDEGIYRLLDRSGQKIAEIKYNYVPHGVVPGNYGDYVHLIIDIDGFITNWPRCPDVSEFFRKNK